MKLIAWIVVPLAALLTLAPARAVVGAQTVAEKTAKAADKTKDAVVKGAKITAEKTKEGLSKTGEVMTDAWITTRVHERFVGEDLLKGSDISVDTSHHVVTLKGTVMGQAGRTKAGNVARHTEGVHRVVNRLTIGAKRQD
jgi:hyperosmotically inducible protein